MINNYTTIIKKIEREKKFNQSFKKIVGSKINFPPGRKNNKRAPD